MSTPTPPIPGTRQARHALARSLHERLRAWSGWPYFQRLLDQHPTVSVYLYGGAIRELLLGRAGFQKDFDFLFEAESMQPFVDTLSAWGPVDLGPFENVLWTPPTDDDTYCDMQVIPKMNTGIWPCENIWDVLGEVDATCNALAFDLRTHEVFDSQNGHRDISRGILRAVRVDRRDLTVFGMPFAATVWFRLYHYAGHCGFEIEPVTQAWLDAHDHYAVHQETFEQAYFEPNLSRRGSR